MRIATVAVLTLAFTITAAAETRPRLRELGVSCGILQPGARNAITDVEGVRVGHTTVNRGENIRTGVTAILPHGGNLFQEKVPAAIFVGNGFGKLTGSTQVEELGELESPILLTSTLNVARVSDALLDYMLAQPGNENVRSINTVVGETNDGTLSDIRARPVSAADVMNAIKTASAAEVAEGAVGAGTGTVAFGFKGGIGTSSRKLPPNLGGYTVGVLVQSNYGGILTICGAPVGIKLGQHYLKSELPSSKADGSIMIVVATDAPVDARNLERMGARAMMGLARTGAAGTNGSGDYAIAFSTAAGLRIRHGEKLLRNVQLLPNDAMSPLFLATVEATEEAIYNSLLRATTTTGNGTTIKALPLEQTREILKRHGRSF
ncbi:MAG TPA: P1 family peptidase [Thermoanaerobaculia bacterium]|nr:P1 family peptidase [Thermoanaerobaculia bacterium]